MDCYQTIGNKLKTLREIKNLKQIDIATVLNIKQPYYSQLEKGKKQISLEQLIKIADEFDIELDWFTGRNVETNKRLKNS